MRYYILDHQLPYHEKADIKIDGVIFDNTGDFVTNIFNIGISLGISEFKIKAHSETSKNGKLRDKLWVQINRSSLLFVASPKVIELFEELNIRDCEYLNVQISDVEIKIENFKIINVLKRVDCIDDEQSELVYYTDTDKIYAIDYLNLDQDKIPPGLDIFQLDRIEKNVTVVSQRFVDKVNEKELTGFRFIPPEKFSIG
jgi:hypothetical protein